MTESGEVTRLLASVRSGDPAALDRVVPLVYNELRSAARRQLRREHPGHTLSSVALVHEAYLKLVSLRRIDCGDRVHFVALAARLMRQVLLRHAERRGAAKRGGGAERISLDVVRTVVGGPDRRYGDLNAALERLDALSPRQCRVVECRFFGGLGIEETAEALDVSPATVKRDWTLARAWLNRELS